MLMNTQNMFVEKWERTVYFTGPDFFLDSFSFMKLAYYKTRVDGIWWECGVRLH